MFAADAPWRVYLKEWLTVYGAGYMGEAGEQECWEHFAAKYGGRVRAEDCEVISVASDDFWPALRARLWNLKGEFKDLLDARKLHAELQDFGGYPQLVQRGSPEEQALLDYGKRKLPDAG